ncbi:OmpA/MotB domain protein [Rhodomicrobium vannielii ATCC 17100]|uniref:OmpA/MotB domain protein n=1 Tax=Rhodomicrobium vannielii (strain ATCC 17100 / DSM 162 / LMG 4299 / NCIMB 10020 / ATH 3.1.1) TaxID=648757 RepID=E3I2W7_RHOVT|nr:peptidoglycan -binding protein [Rhodomicrobium vannielii]ADP72562.1 OmpA/MotB domain protein [Rhodomicrobium vannielii ATCC 17100]MBJ7535419.1 peptidoglycan -binding protein [Rhodomicrobium vannielii ATCC 17100]
MALSKRRRPHAVDYWPGFVDALSTLLLVVTFLMVLFMVAQYFAAQDASGKDTALAKLQRQIAQMADLLSLERSQKKTAMEETSGLRETLAASSAENKRLTSLLSVDSAKSGDARVAAVTTQLDEQKSITAQALAQVELLNQQILALRKQLAALENSLGDSDKRDKQAQAQISDLGQRLNVALAKRVQELSQYRSTFFGELKKSLGDRDDIQVVGDRFVFQSEIFFDSGSADLSPLGYAELDKLGTALRDLENKIPRDINWVLRIDGHTDVRPIATAAFRSNWELSSQRAISVVKYLVSKGVPPNRLVAAGFGEYQPLTSGYTDADLRRNRRIELKLTEK